MSIESRMDEFERVSKKIVESDVKTRMEEFQQVNKSEKHSLKEKSSTLPYGLKRFKPCPMCGEFMEIQEMKNNEAIYHCPSCNEEIREEIK